MPQAAQANFRTRGVRAVGYQSDMRAHAPDAQLAAITLHWGGRYTAVARSVLDGSWTPRPFWGGMATGVVGLDALHPDLPADARKLVDSRREAIADGSFKPFAAPLTDNEGKLRLAAGALDDTAIATMNWFVRGVTGAVPKP